MKFRSTMMAGIALTLGVAVAGFQPAAAMQKAKKGEAAAKPAAPDYKLSKPVREAVVAAQTAIAANDAATANARLAEARAAVQTEDDRFVTGSLSYDAARLANDEAGQLAAVEMMLASGRVPADRLPSFYMVQAQSAYNKQDYQKAEAALTQVIQLDPNNRDAYPVLVETKAKLNKPQEAVQTLDKAIAMQQQANQPIPEQWLKRGFAIAYTAKLPAETQRYAQTWVANYPGTNSWHDALVVYRDFNRSMDPATELDLMRLMRATGSLRGEREYLDYVRPLYLGYPGEADAVLKEGIAKGVLNQNSVTVKEFGGAVRGKLAAARAELPAAAADAAKASTGKTALQTADAYLGFADYAKAAELYRLALQKGQVDPNIVNLRLGIALALSGQAPAAKQAFSSVTGPRAELAKYWSLYADKRTGA